MNHRIP